MNLFGGALALLGVLLFAGVTCSLHAGLPSFIKRVDDEGTTYLVYRYDPRIHELKLYWQSRDGKPLETFVCLNSYLKENGRELLFATNSGIFEPGYRPTGLHVEEGREKAPLNIAAGKGNFFLEPNGVFFVRDDKASILSTSQYRRKVRKPNLAIQSGPLLLEDGEIHHRFRKESTSVYIRSGVGITRDDHIFIVLSEEKVNLFDFAHFFKDQLNCSAALYLDGGISQFYLPDKFTLSRKRRYAGFLAILARRD